MISPHRCLARRGEVPVVVSPHALEMPAGLASDLYLKVSHDDDFTS